MVQCRVCYRDIPSWASTCPQCNYPVGYDPAHPVSGSDIAAIGALALTSFVTRGLQDFASSVALIRAHDRASAVVRILEACVTGDYREALRIERSISIPDYYPDDVKANFKFLRNLGKGIANLADADSKVAVDALEEVVRDSIAMRKPAASIGAAHALAARAYAKHLQNLRTANTALIRQGLAHIDAAIDSLPPEAPEADYYVFRAAFRLGLGDAAMAEWDLDIALTFDPQHTSAVAMRRDLARLRGR